MRTHASVSRIVLLLLGCAICSDATASDDDPDGFVDVGIRLIGDNQDSLIADLIANERDVFNAGHVRWRTRR